jgi:hypothetical protein
MIAGQATGKNITSKITNKIRLRLINLINIVIKTIATIIEMMPWIEGENLAIASL